MGFPSAPPPVAPKSGATAIVAVFVGVMLALAVVGIVIVVFSAPPAPVPPCKPDEAGCAPQQSLPPVGNASPTPFRSISPSSAPGSLAPGATATPFIPAPTPVSNAPVVLSGAVWNSPTLNFSFEYDPGSWILLTEDSTDDTAVFSSVQFDCTTVIHAVTADTSPAELIAQQLATVDTFMIGRVKDTDDYDALLGPSIGYVNGEGDVYSGTLLGSDGTPVAPGGVTVLAATDGRLTVAVTVVVGSPDADFDSGTQEHAARSSADEFLKSFDWDSND